MSGERSELIPEKPTAELLTPAELRDADHQEDLAEMMDLMRIDSISRVTLGLSKEVASDTDLRNAVLLDGGHYESIQNPVYIIARDKNLSIIGMRLLSEQDPKCGMVNSLMVTDREGFRGQKIGSLVVDASIDAARARGYERLQVETDAATSTNALHLLNTRKFVIVGHRDAPGGRKIFKYEKDLTQSNS